MGRGKGNSANTVMVRESNHRLPSGGSFDFGNNKKATVNSSRGGLLPKLFPFREAAGDRTVERRGRSKDRVDIKKKKGTFDGGPGFAGGGRTRGICVRGEEAANQS